MTMYVHGYFFTMHIFSDSYKFPHPKHKINIKNITILLNYRKMHRNTKTCYNVFVTRYKLNTNLQILWYKTTLLVAYTSKSRSGAGYAHAVSALWVYNSTFRSVLQLFGLNIYYEVYICHSGARIPNGGEFPVLTRITSSYINVCNKQTIISPGMNKESHVVRSENRVVDGMQRCSCKSKLKT